jgi:hypothetical protein
MKLMSFKFGTEHVRDFDVILVSTLYFSEHINYKYFQALEFLGLIRFVTYNSLLDILKILYISLFKSKLQCTSCCITVSTLYCVSLGILNILSKLRLARKQGRD